MGSGGREHAITWKLAQSPQVTDLLAAPGNAGTAQVACNVPTGADDIDGLLRFARENAVDLTVVGPEAALAGGIADRFHDAGLPLLGPTQEAARIESSKTFAKELMLSAGVPTAAAKSFTSFREAADYVQRSPLPIVVKADGLAAGKGVVVAQTSREAVDALRQRMEERAFGPAGDRVLVEECMEGQELSVFAFVDGDYVSPMVAACDYKRVGDGDVGPNTGGIGSFSPPRFWTDDLERRVRLEIMEPVANALERRGSPYQGVLYAGLMLTDQGPKVVEFNCRLGDPEAQVILPRLKTDLAEVMMGTAQGRLAGMPVEWGEQACVGVVVASGGYPGEYATGYPIDGLDELEEDILVFHAGTKAVGSDPPPGVVTHGGRVLTVTATGETLEQARSKVYANIGRVRFKDSFYRKDIAAVA